MEIVDKDHPLAIEYRCNNTHVTYVLVPWGAWPLPITCSCGEAMFPIGSPYLPEKDKLESLHGWQK